MYSERSRTIRDGGTKMSRQKILQTRNPRVSFNGEEIDYLLGLVDEKIGKGKLDHDKMLFQLTIYKKLQTAR